MSTVSRWVLPAYISDSKHSTDPIKFDLTKALKTILNNAVWERKIKYGFETGLKDTKVEDIKQASIVIHPRFFSGIVYKDRISTIVEDVCGNIPEYLDVENYKKWSHRLGVVIIEVEYHTDIDCIPTEKDITEDEIPHFNKDFIHVYHRYAAVLEELTSLFLATLHLTFPTSSLMGLSDQVNDGLFVIKQNEMVYGAMKESDSFMHEVLIEFDKISNIKNNLDGLSKVWHYNLWSLKRYLVAVESNQTTMDNLLDLIYALEGLFEKSTSSDFVKMMCLVQLCKRKTEARKIKSILDLAYRIRNEIAHGGHYYDAFDKVKLNGKEILAQDVYWELKGVLAVMIIKAISKLLSKKEMKNLRFNEDDLINKVFTS